MRSIFGHVMVTSRCDCGRGRAGDALSRSLLTPTPGGEGGDEGGAVTGHEHDVEYRVTGRVDGAHNDVRFLKTEEDELREGERERGERGRETERGERERERGERERESQVRERARRERGGERR